MQQQQTLIEKIIDNARWAPSGDNMQTWRFEITGNNHFIIQGYDTSDHCIYDLEGHASHLAIGTLIESISIAASTFHHHTEFKLRKGSDQNKIIVDVFLTEDKNLPQDALFEYLPRRTVQRRIMKRTPLTLEQKQALTQTVGKFYSIKWLESFPSRLRAAWLMQKYGKLRLTLPEAFATHSTVIEWNARYSKDKIPDQAVGLDFIATRMMRWALKSWSRVEFLNKYCFGTVLPRIELDFIPGICCAAHFALISEQKPQTIEDYVQAGRAVQRFWLTAAQLGLQLQPEMTPIIFSHYVAHKLPFTKREESLSLATQLAKCFSTLLGADISQKAIFIGRIGKGKPANSRSIRLSNDELII